MAKLILSIEGATLKEIPLVKERTTIGRKAQNDIQIDNLAISGEHAVLVTAGADVFLEDMDSTNGTFVNGNPVSKHALRNGDVIALGKYNLQYVAESSVQASAADFEKTMILRPGAMAAAERTGAFQKPQTPPAAPAQPAAPSQTTGPLGIIQIISGGNAGKSLELSKTLTTLGKPGVQVAVITRRPHGYFITHVEGTNFPVVNGKSIGAQACQLTDHAIIELAGTKMEFFLKV